MKSNQRVIENQVIGDKVCFLALAAETQGQLTQLHIELGPGGGSELHYHDKFVETFKARKGELSVELDGELLVLEEGQEKRIEKLALHRFFNPSANPITFEVKIEPASRNFEEFLQIMYGLAEDGKTNKQGIPTNLLHIGAISLLGDTLPPKGSLLGILSKLFGWLGRIAERRGVLEELREKYVTF